MKVEQDFETREKWLEYRLMWAVRDQTGMGLMDCKAALTETNWNVEKAIEYFSSEEWKRITRFRI